MATNLKRFTISITPNMEADLNLVKQQFYYKTTQNYMIRDLIIKGLSTLEEKNSNKETYDFHTVSPVKTNSTYKKENNK